MPKQGHPEQLSRKKLDEYLKAQRELREMDRASGAHQLSTHGRQARAELMRAGMPPAERNDSDVGEGSRHKVPVRYE